jgi:hypothetical protein
MSGDWGLATWRLTPVNASTSRNHVNFARRYSDNQWSSRFSIRNWDEPWRGAEAANRLAVPSIVSQ